MEAHGVLYMVLKGALDIQLNTSLVAQYFIAEHTCSELLQCAKNRAHWLALTFHWSTNCILRAICTLIEMGLGGGGF